MYSGGHSPQLRLIPYLHHTSSVLRYLPLELLSEIFNEGGIKIISLSNIRPIIIYFHSLQCRLIPYLHQRPIFFKANKLYYQILKSSYLQLIITLQSLRGIMFKQSEHIIHVLVVKWFISNLNSMEF
jgi:hypothetical protein